MSTFVTPKTSRRAVSLAETTQMVTKQPIGNNLTNRRVTRSSTARAIVTSQLFASSSSSQEEETGNVVTPKSGKRKNEGNVDVVITPTTKRRRSTQRTTENVVTSKASNSDVAIPVTPDGSATESCDIDAIKKTKKRTVVKKKDTVPKTTIDIEAVSNTIATKKGPPKGWEQIYSLVEELRQDRTAPCDGDGAEALPQPNLEPKVFRFQTLIALMLSSQTKDAVVGAAMRRLQEHGLTVENLHPDKTSAETLKTLIHGVGFHNNKTKYIHQVVQILLEKYDGDIPPTAAEMIKELPGVGPKMAFIVESICWETQTGIGVDTHMHRLFPLVGYVSKSVKNPEQTRIELEAWLPQEHWKGVNLLWVGFGQEIQQEKPKLLRKAIDCSRPYEALKLLQRCGMDVRKEGAKCGWTDEISEIFASVRNS
ncbi:DNA glycosylase [Nitzschia inconspicua]|uniref:DNA-(apurinic or apyrimidinic site) lyase n=1 Tax=Nitzschia inconspicua TaxID=303405 RepID=A0A9K3M603_9STRA|nr:DNA glycosylase [Nitzschia inconspicua]